jgi:hypothetical protein
MMAVFFVIVIAAGVLTCVIGEGLIRWHCRNDDNVSGVVKLDNRQNQYYEWGGYYASWPEEKGDP